MCKDYNISSGMRVKGILSTVKVVSCIIDVKNFMVVESVVDDIHQVMLCCCELHFITFILITK